MNEMAETTGLATSREKTEMLRINNKNKEPLLFNSEPIEDVVEFRYVASIIGKDGGTKQGIKARKKKAQAAFIQLRPVWKSKKTDAKIKIKIYRSNVRAVLLCGSESWRMTEDD